MNKKNNKLPKYYCKYCIYPSNKLFNIKKHLLTKKHMNNTLNHDEYNNNINNIANYFSKSKTLICDSENDDCDLKNIDDIKNTGMICIYCEKNILYKRNLKSHHKRCKEKKKYEELQLKHKELQQKNEIIADLIKETKNKDKALNDEKQKNAILIEEKDRLEDEYQDFIKELARNNSKPITVVNMMYVINNFNEALDYEKIMDKPLTIEEEKRMLMLGPLHGCIDLIKSRCIDGIDPDLRSLHCTDASRKRFSYYSNGKWRTDYRGEIIVEKAMKHIDDVFFKNFKGSIEKKSEYISYLADIKMNGKGKKFILDKLIDPLLLSNIDIKLIKKK